MRLTALFYSALYLHTGLSNWLLTRGFAATLELTASRGRSHTHGIFYTEMHNVRRVRFEWMAKQHPIRIVQETQ